MGVRAARWNLRKISLGQMLGLASHEYREAQSHFAYQRVARGTAPGLVPCVGGVGNGTWVSINGTLRR